MVEELARCFLYDVLYADAAAVLFMMYSPAAGVLTAVMLFMV